MSLLAYLKLHKRYSEMCSKVTELTESNTKASRIYITALNYLTSFGIKMRLCQNDGRSAPLLNATRWHGKVKRSEGVHHRTKVSILELTHRMYYT